MAVAAVRCGGDVGALGAGGRAVEGARAGGAGEVWAGGRRVAPSDPAPPEGGPPAPGDDASPPSVEGAGRGGGTGARGKAAAAPATVAGAGEPGAGEPAGVGADTGAEDEPESDVEAVAGAVPGTGVKTGADAAPVGLGSGTLPGSGDGEGSPDVRGATGSGGTPGTAPPAAGAPAAGEAALGCGSDVLWGAAAGVADEGAPPGWAPELGGDKLAEAPAAAVAAAAAAATWAGEGVAGALAGCPPAVTGRAFSGVARGTWRTGGAPVAARPSRAAASALTRCSCSAERSGARPAHSRNRLSSRACANTSSDRTAIPTSAANAAIAPICVNELDSDSASGEATVMNPGSVRAAQA